MWDNLSKLEAEINWLTTEIAEKEREFRVGQEAAGELPVLRKQLQKVGLEYSKAVTEQYAHVARREAV